MPLAFQVKTINEHLSRLIPDQRQLPYSAARYALFGGGKRIRPRLVLAVCGDEKALDAAAAIECMHTYSLIHDDLPCMDDDDIRRGKPTLHKMIGEGQALLVGDYLQLLAFELIANSNDYSAEQKVELIRVLSASCGASGMIGGQVSDLQGKGNIIEMHRCKTGALMRCSLEFGAIISQSDAREQLSLCGEAIGIAYQLFDDLADGDYHLGELETSRLAEKYYHDALKYADGFPELQTLIRTIL